MKTSFILFIAVLTFSSCGPEKRKDQITVQPVRSTNELFSNSAPATPPGQSSDQAGTQTTGSGLNPAHGMPGHRCEIPVGAPLDSKQPMNVTATPKVITPTQVVPTQSAVVAGTNPAHGQPGHDCSIPVGAPLKN